MKGTFVWLMPRSKLYYVFISIEKKRTDRYRYRLNLFLQSMNSSAYFVYSVSIALETKIKTAASVPSAWTSSPYVWVVINSPILYSNFPISSVSLIF